MLKLNNQLNNSLNTLNKTKLAVAATTATANTTPTNSMNTSNGISEGLFFNSDQLNGTDPIEFSVNNPLFMNSLSNPYMPSTTTPQGATHFNNHSPSFSVNSLKMRQTTPRSQYGLAHTKLINQYLNDSNDLLTSSCSLAPVSTTTTATVTTANTITAAAQVPLLDSQAQQQQQQQQVDDCDWDKLEEAAKVIANVQHAFEMSDTEINEYNDDEQTYHHLNHRIASNSSTRFNRPNYGVNFNQNGHANLISVSLI